MDTTMTTRNAFAPAFVYASALVASARAGFGLGARRPLDRSSCLLR